MGDFHLEKSKAMSCRPTLRLLMILGSLQSCGAGTVLQVVKSDGQPSQESNESAAAEGYNESGASQGSDSGSSDSSSVVSISGFESLPASASQGDQFLISDGVFAGTSITIGAALGGGFQVIAANMPTTSDSPGRYVFVTDNIVQSFSNNLTMYNITDSPDTRYPNYPSKVTVGGYQIVRDHQLRSSGADQRFEFKMSVLSSTGTELATAKLRSHDVNNVYSTELHAKAAGTSFNSHSGTVSYSGKTEVQELFSGYNYSTAYAGNVIMNLNFTNNTGTITANNLSDGSRSGSYNGTLTIAPDTGQLTGKSTVSLMLDSNSYTVDILGILGPDSNVAAGALIDQNKKFHGLFAVGKN
jgi:hypothetical protein